MYYRYRAKKKDRRFLKTAVFVILVSAVFYFAYNNRTQLMFWKITENRIVADINRAAGIKEESKRIRELDRLVESMEIYKEENPFDSHAYIMSARINFIRAVSETGKTFSEMYVYDLFKDISEDVKKQLLLSIRDFNKGIALSEGKAMTSADTIMLGKALFINNYYNPREIYSQISGIKPGKDLELEDIRFYIILAALTGNFEEALAVAGESGRTGDTIEGRMFYATLLKDAGKYTESIMAFRKIAEESSDSSVRKAAHFNLGQIYYRQRLYRESLAQFESILAEDSADVNSKIWLGKNYSAMGDRERAKAIWGEVLSVNSSNREVKKLLGLI